VATPSADADIVRLDSIKDLYQNRHSRATSIINFGSSWVEVNGLTQTFTLTKQCDLFITCCVQSQVSSEGDTLVYLRPRVDTTDMDQYIWALPNNMAQTFSAFWRFGPVGPGSHTVRLYIRTHAGGRQYGTRQMGLILIPSQP